MSATARPEARRRARRISLVLVGAVALGLATATPPSALASGAQLIVRVDPSARPSDSPIPSSTSAGSAAVPAIGSPSAPANGSSSVPAISQPTNSQAARPAPPVPANGPASQSQDSLTAPSTAGLCGSDAPIKAVTSEEGERTFYVPGDEMYDAILAERCFPNEGAASSAGYRPHRH